MATHDPFQLLDELETPLVDAIVNRLEFRGRDPNFSRWRDDYLGRLDLEHASRVLDVGCGTGVVTRAIGARTDVTGDIFGSDPSRAMIDAARRLASEEGLASRMTFRQDDTASLDLPDASFDRVIAHTVVSHAVDPEAILREMIRVLAPGGRLAVFDGDYASMTLGHPDAEFANAMNKAFLGAIVANPTIMREMPHLLRDAGLDDFEVMAWVYAEVGTAAFFRNSLETLTPWMVINQTATQEQVDRWVAYQREAIEEGEFFGFSNFYVYIATRPGNPVE